MTHPAPLVHYDPVQGPKPYSVFLDAHGIYYPSFPAAPNIHDAGGTPLWAFTRTPNPGPGTVPPVPIEALPPAGPAHLVIPPGGDFAGYADNPCTGPTCWNPKLRVGARRGNPDLGLLTMDELGAGYAGSGPGAYPIAYNPGFYDRFHAPTSVVGWPTTPGTVQFNPARERDPYWPDWHRGISEAYADGLADAKAGRAPCKERAHTEAGYWFPAAYDQGYDHGLASARRDREYGLANPLTPRETASVRASAGAADLERRGANMREDFLEAAHYGGRQQALLEVAHDYGRGRNPLPPTVEGMVFVLEHELTRYDRLESAKEGRRRHGQVNIYRLGHLLAAASRVKARVGHLGENRADAPALRLLKEAIAAELDPSLPPAKWTLAEIDRVIATGKAPRYRPDPKRRNPMRPHPLGPLKVGDRLLNVTIAEGEVGFRDLGKLLTVRAVHPERVYWTLSDLERGEPTVGWVTLGDGEWEVDVGLEWASEELLRLTPPRKKAPKKARAKPKKTPKKTPKKRQRGNPARLEVGDFLQNRRPDGSKLLDRMRDTVFVRAIGRGQVTVGDGVFEVDIPRRMAAAMPRARASASPLGGRSYRAPTPRKPRPPKSGKYAAERRADYAEGKKWRRAGGTKPPAYMLRDPDFKRGYTEAQK